MALSPDEKKIYINADTTAGQADGSMYFPVKYLTGLESVTNNTVTLYFRGPNNTTSTSVIVLITTDFIKEFYTQFVNEINFGDKAVITLAVKNLSVSTTQGGSDFVYVNATAGAIIANDDTTAYEDLQIAEDLDVGGNLDVVGTITGDVTGDVTGNADTATLAVSTSALVVADESTDTTCFPVFVTAATGVTLAAKSGSNLTFNSNSGLLTATLLAGNLTGDVTGNADTATALATARAINGVDFDGSAAITVTAAGSTLSDTVTVAKGGTGATSLTADGVLFGNGTSAISAVDLSSNGNIIVGGSTPAVVTGANLAGSGLAATVGNGTLVLAVETLNQNTTGSAATLTTARAINGVNFDGSAPITVTAAGSTLSDTVTVAKGGTGLTTVAANTILTGNATGALTSEANFTFGSNRLTIGNNTEDIQPYIRMFNDVNTLELGIANGNDDFVAGSVDGDVVLNSFGDHNVIIGQNDVPALTIDTNGAVVTAGDLKVNGTDIYGPTDGDLNLRSDGNIALFLDGDNDESSQFKILNSSSGTVFSVTEAGVGALNGEYLVTGGKVNVASEAQAPIGMHVARRTITTAEANAMHSTPIEVVPAQGADTIIMPVNCLTRVDRAANQTNSACDMNAHYADKEPGTYLTASLLHWRRFMFGETTDHSEIRTPVSSTSGVTLTESVNKGIELSFDSAATTDCFTSIDVFTTYYVIDIS